MESLGSRLKHGWNAFLGKSTNEEIYRPENLGFISSDNPSRIRLTGGNERSIVSAAINRIALDVASFDFQHVILDQNGRYESTVDDSLNRCLTIEANKDQTGRALIQDIVMSMFDEGVVAVVPIETDVNPLDEDEYTVIKLRVAKVTSWYPDHIQVQIYNDITGTQEYLYLPKKKVAIIENPLYPIMNEPNSTLKRLVRAINLLDVTDEKTSSGKLDLIIQLPYTVRSEKRQSEAKERVAAISQQLESNKYGVAYADATERIIQLNRPIENNLLDKVRYLTNMFYDQIGMSENIFNGKASPSELQNYYDRSVEPIVTAIVDELKRKFISENDRSNRSSIMAFRDIFRLIPASELANMADVFSRNAIFSANDWRQILGRKPSSDPKANELSNKNMPTPNTKNAKVEKEQLSQLRRQLEEATKTNGLSGR